MNNKTLLNKIFLKTSLKKDVAIKLYNSLFDEIKNSLSKKENVSIDDIGEFIFEHRESKVIIDYKKKSKVLLPPKDKITFKSSESLINYLKD